MGVATAADGSVLRAPRHGPCRLPPTLLLQGRRGIFYSDTLRFASELRGAGVDVTLLDEPDAFHVYPGAIVTPESRRAFGAIRALTTRVTR